jgi:hypothetical protein
MVPNQSSLRSQPAAFQLALGPHDPTFRLTVKWSMDGYFGKWFLQQECTEHIVFSAALLLTAATRFFDR